MQSSQAIINASQTTVLNVEINTVTQEYTIVLKDGSVVCTEQVFQKLSVHLYQEVQVQLQLQAFIRVGHCLKVCVPCVKEELKCFLDFTCAALKEVVYCLALEIQLSVEHALHLFKEKVECSLELLKETAAHVLMEVAYAFHVLGHKICASWAKIKLAAYWGAAKLRAICHSLGVKLNFAWHELKRAIKQAKWFIRSAFHAAHDLVKAGIEWIKSVWNAFRCKIHRVKTCVLSALHRKCLEVLLPCMDKHIIARMSIAHTEVQAICHPLMWSNINIQSSLWETSKKESHVVVAKFFEWNELHAHVKSVTVSYKRTEEHRRFIVASSATQFFTVLQHNSCSQLKPTLVRFKDATIRSEWTKILNQTSIKRVEARRSDFEAYTTISAETYTTFSVDIAELHTSTTRALLHSQLKTLRVIVKYGEKASGQDSLVKNRKTTKYAEEVFTQETYLRAELVKARQYVFPQVQHLNLEQIKFEFVQRTTKRVTMVTCQAPFLVSKGHLNC